MKPAIFLIPMILIAFLLPGCGGSGGTNSSSPVELADAGPKLGFSVTNTLSSNVTAVVASEDGGALVIRDTGPDGKMDEILVEDSSGIVATVSLDRDGLPETVVISDGTRIEFSNYSETRVDARITHPDGTVTREFGVTLLVPVSTLKTAISRSTISFVGKGLSVEDKEAYIQNVITSLALLLSPTCDLLEEIPTTGLPCSSTVVQQVDQALGDPVVRNVFELASVNLPECETNQSVDAAACTGAANQKTIAKAKLIDPQNPIPQPEVPTATPEDPIAVPEDPALEPAT